MKVLALLLKASSRFHLSVFQPPTIPTESFTYENNTDDIPISTKNVPFVKTKTQTVTYEKDGYPYETEDGILISSQSHSTRSQTIETTTVSSYRQTVVSYLLTFLNCSLNVYIFFTYSIMENAITKLACWIMQTGMFIYRIKKASAFKLSFISSAIC